jgi:hypothetical protein
MLAGDHGSNLGHREPTSLSKRSRHRLFQSLDGVLLEAEDLVSPCGGEWDPV